MGKFYKNAKKLSSVRKKLADIKRRNRREKRAIAKKLCETVTNAGTSGQKGTAAQRKAILAKDLGQIQKIRRLNLHLKNRTDAPSENPELDVEPNEDDIDCISKFNSNQLFKSYYKEFKKVVDAADVVIEVLDARDPLGTRCTQVEQDVLSSGNGKRLILLLNKIDLVPRENLEKWLKYLRQEFPTVAFKASTQSQADHLARAGVAALHMNEKLQSSRRCVGANFLMKVLGNYCRNQNILTSIKVGIVGFPNVGKSSIINSLKRCRTCTVGATPGVTKSMQEVVLDKHIRLLDSPGVVFDKEGSSSSLALHNAMKVEKLDDPVTPAEEIIKRTDRKQLIDYYRIAEFNTTQEFLCFLAQRIGRFKKGGIPDAEAAARKLLNDWNSGIIKYCTEPPEVYHPNIHVSSELVAEMSKAFDIDSAEQIMELDKADENDSIADTAVIDPASTVHHEVTSMDTDQPSTPAVSVKLGTKTRKKETTEKKEQYMLPEFQQNKLRKKAFKRLKKKLRRNDKHAAALSDIVNASLSI